MYTIRLPTKNRNREIILIIIKKKVKIRMSKISLYHQISLEEAIGQFS